MMSIRRAPELLGRAASASGAALVALLLLVLPKCPLCVAAYLVAFGVSAGAALAVAPYVRPLTFVLAALASFAVAVGVSRLRQRRAAPRCCSVRSSSSKVRVFTPE
ncbi:hypothetical protein WMF30_36965 [Sorangium sp. So ce134]